MSNHHSHMNSNNRLTTTDMPEAAPEMETGTNKTDDVKILDAIKHPLEHTWSFWLFTNTKGTTNWEDNLVKLTTFDTVEDYWRLYHHMKVPSELSMGQDYAIFKDDIRPMWEDSANKRGGRWLISFDKKRNSNIDNIWLFVILLLIGENFQNNDVINGAVVNIRVKSKVGVWISDSNRKEAILEIGQRLKDQLGLHARINFHKHNSTENIFTI